MTCSYIKNSVWRKQNSSILQFRMFKSLSIDHLRLKITLNWVVKSRISVNNSGSIRGFQTLQVTRHEE